MLAGILSAEADGELLRKAVKVVASGELWLGHLTIKNILTQAMFVKKSITRQETEIAGLILRVFCNKEIARELKIAEGDRKSRCNRLFKSFNVSGRLQFGLKLRGLQHTACRAPRTARTDYPEGPKIPRSRPGHRTSFKNNSLCLSLKHDRMNFITGGVKNDEARVERLSSGRENAL